MASNALAVIFLSLGLSLGCLTLVLGPVILVEFVSKKDHGKIQGWFMALTSLGGLVGPYATGKLVQSAANMTVGFHSAFQICALVLAVCGTLAIIGVRPRKKEAVSEVQLKDIPMPE